MNIIDFISTQWQVIESAPVQFITTAALFFGLGFAAGKIIFGTMTEVAKARLEAARDDLARLEKRKRDELHYLEELAKIKEQIEGQPKINIVEKLPENPKKEELYFVTGKASE